MPNTRLCENKVEEKFINDYLILPMTISLSTSDNRQFNAFHDVKIESWKYSWFGVNRGGDISRRPNPTDTDGYINLIDFAASALRNWFTEGRLETHGSDLPTRGIPNYDTRPTPPIHSHPADPGLMYIAKLGSHLTMPLYSDSESPCFAIDSSFTYLITQVPSREYEPPFLWTDK